MTSKRVEKEIILPTVPLAPIEEVLPPTPPPSLPTPVLTPTPAPIPISAPAPAPLPVSLPTQIQQSEPEKIISPRPAPSVEDSKSDAPAQGTIKKRASLLAIFPRKNLNYQEPSEGKYKLISIIINFLINIIEK